MHRTIFLIIVTERINIMRKICKYLVTTVFSVSLLLSAFVFAFAAVPTENGTYSVPVTLYHSEKDKESMGNKYIHQTALITVENGNKTITVVADGVDNLTFSYYTNGSVEGETKEATTVKNVKIGNDTYAVGYSFPLVTDNEYVGVKFKAPIMPMSPSARLKINYNGIEALDVETTTQQETTAEKDETVIAEAESSVSESTVIAQTSETADNAQATAAETQAQTTIEVTTETATVSENGSETRSKESGALLPAVIVASVVAEAAMIIIIKKRIAK